MALPPGVFEPLIEEDGWIEWVGGIALFGACALAVLCFIRERRGGTGIKQLAYLGLAVFFFAAGGEEISWGQRVFGFATPENIDRVNKQGEFNVHNVSALGKAPEVVFLAVWLALAVLIPVVMALSSPRTRERLRNLVPVLPLAFAVMFLGNYVLAKIAQQAVEGWGSYASSYPIVHSATEIKETVFELLFGLAMWRLWALGDWAPTPDPGAPGSRRDRPQGRRGGHGLLGVNTST